MTTEETYIELLTILKERKIPFTVTGTFALYLQNTKFVEAYKIQDCDIFIPFQEEVLVSFINTVRSESWFVSVWGETVDVSNVINQLSGKYYLRAEKNGLIIDATYEHEKEIYGDPEKDAIMLNGFSVIRASKVLEGKRYRANERDHKAITIYELL